MMCIQYVLQSFQYIIQSFQYIVQSFSSLARFGIVLPLVTLLPYLPFVLLAAPCAGRWVIGITIGYFFYTTGFVVLFNGGDVF